MLINAHLGGLVCRGWILLYVKSGGQIKLITMILVKKIADTIWSTGIGTSF
jgi:hypothetical protein